MARDLSAARSVFRLALAVACGAALALLAVSLRGGFAWDDAWLIVNNANIQRPERLARALVSGFWDVSDRRTDGLSWRYWRPVITLLYAGLWRLAGARAFAYHLVNVAAHLGCVALAAVWLRDRFGEAVATRRVAFVGAVTLFAVHASRAESVAWVSGCTDVWMTLWALAAHALWQRGRRAGACAAAVVAALCKETAFALPLLMAVDTLCDAHTTNDARPPRERLRELVPLVLTLAATFVLRAVLVPERGLARLAAAPPGVVRRVLSSVGVYAGRALFPWPSRALFRPALYETVPWVLAGAVVVALLLVVALRARHSTAARGALADLAWASVPLLPVLNVVPMFECTLVAQRFLYLPVLGLCALALRLASVEGLPGRAATVVLSALVVTHGVALGAMAPTWRDDVTLWTHERAVDAGDFYACRQLVAARSLTDRRGALTLAVTCSREATRAGEHREGFALGLRAMGQALDAIPDRAQGELRALRDAYDTLGEGHDATVMLDGRALTLSPRRAGPGALGSDPSLYWIPAAMARMRTGDLAGAARGLRAVLAQAPTNVPALTNLALVYARQERWRDAVVALDRARALRPGDAFIEGLAGPIGAGASLATMPDAPPRWMTHAAVMLDLHQPDRALAALARFGDDAPPQAVMLRIRALVAMGARDEAVRVVEARAAQDAVNRARWGEVLARLRALPAR